VGSRTEPRGGTGIPKNEATDCQRHQPFFRLASLLLESLSYRSPASRLPLKITGCETPMSIGFQEFDVQQFRAELAKMSDAELMSLGRSLRSLCYPRVVAPNKSTFDTQLDECRAGWRRRHPRLTIFLA